MAYLDDLNRLAGKYRPANRYANFGPIVERVEVNGFRGINNVPIDITSPVTALSGLNGTGKSTVAQLLTCAYKKLTTSARPRYYVRDFFPVSVADPSPFLDNASVVYSYCVEKGADLQRVTVSRANREWSGYKRQPERACYYLGFTQFIPKVERRDFSIYSGSFVQLGSVRALDAESIAKASAILGIPYESLGFTEVSHRERSGELATAQRNGQGYSENHMGFGEGRVIYMVNAMEHAPIQSLFVLEEPETSLHGEAQEQLAHYLVDVSSRRGHQIVLTTHSATILGGLARDSVKYLRRSPTDYSLSVVPGMAAYQIDTYLRGAPTPGSRVICVEDEFSKCWTIELIRACSPALLAGVKFVQVGGAEQVPAALRLLKEAGAKTVGLLDGDQSSADTDIRILPGPGAPEVKVFTDGAVQAALSREFGVDIGSVLPSVADPHDYCSAIAGKAVTEESVIAQLACRSYALDHSG